MYLSRLILNPRHRRVQRELANPYELHRTLMRGFPDGLETLNDERVLFRVEVEPRTGVPVVLVQSLNQPDWSWLVASEGYLLPESGWPAYVFANPATKTFDLPLSLGQVLAFRLRANPTAKRRRERNDGTLRPVRDPLYRHSDRKAVYGDI